MACGAVILQVVYSIGIHHVGVVGWQRSTCENVIKMYVTTGPFVRPCGSRSRPRCVAQTTEPRRRSCKKRYEKPLRGARPWACANVATRTQVTVNDPPMELYMCGNARDRVHFHRIRHSIWSPMHSRPLSSRACASLPKKQGGEMNKVQQFHVIARYTQY